MVLRAVLADPNILGFDAEDDRRRDRASSAARLLGAYVNDLESPGGREFAIPAFWRGAWASTLARPATEVSARWFVASLRRLTA